MSATFRSLEHPPTSFHGKSALDEWYARVADVPIDELEIGDLCRALRQELFLDHVVPVALRRIGEEPNAGSLFQGELASVLARIPRSFWKGNRAMLVAARQILAHAAGSVDDEVQRELQLFGDVAQEIMDEGILT